MNVAGVGDQGSAISHQHSAVSPMLHALCRSPRTTHNGQLTGPRPFALHPYQTRVRPCLVARWRTKSGRPALYRGEGRGSGCALRRRPSLPPAPGLGSGVSCILRVNCRLRLAGHDLDLDPAVGAAAFGGRVWHAGVRATHGHDPHSARADTFPSQVAFHDIRSEG